MIANSPQLFLGDHSLLLRSPVEDDQPAIVEFARSLPSEDLLFLPVDLTREDNVHDWLRECMEGATLATLAFEDGQVAGYSAVSRNSVAWMRHVADLRVVVGRAYRRLGLGRTLAIAAVRASVEEGVEKLVAQMTVEQMDAISMFGRLGFQQEAVLRDQVKDRNGEPHDLVVMTHYTAQMLSAYGLAPGKEGYVSRVPPKLRFGEPE